MNKQYDVVIIGAGAAGMMCAIEAGKRDRKVLLLDHAKKIGEKIRISGGGRCNFTNINTDQSRFISSNASYMISALAKYTHEDFIKLMNKHKIKFHEKKLGQLFCDESAQQIIDMLHLECSYVNVDLLSNTSVHTVEKKDNSFLINTIKDEYLCESLVVATGGLSIPKIGASKFGYEIAKQFGLNIIETLPALVPLTFSEDLLKKCKELSGLSVEASVASDQTLFEEGMLFTHRGLSGPSILQISSYWKLGQNIKINLAPLINIFRHLQNKKEISPKQDVVSTLSEIIPKRLAAIICEETKVSGRVADLPNKLLSNLSAKINSWSIKPTGSEG